jgi:hypothetical protein
MMLNRSRTGSISPLRASGLRLDNPPIFEQYPPGQPANLQHITNPEPLFFCVWSQLPGYCEIPPPLLLELFEILHIELGSLGFRLRFYGVVD